MREVNEESHTNLTNLTSQTPPEGARNLRAYLDHIWLAHFADTPCVNTIYIAYCYPWKNRLGLICLSKDETISFIGINTLLSLQQVPEYVLVTTIAHELTHYAHGFGSPLPRRCPHPHANHVVDRELEKRELGWQLRCCQEWIIQHWYPFYDAHRHALRASNLRSKIP